MRNGPALFLRGALLVVSPPGNEKDSGGEDDGKDCIDKVELEGG